MSIYILEYIWLDSKNECRSKTKILKTDIYLNESNLKNFPLWNYDGSSTGQATTEKSEILLKPVKIIKDPFRKKLETNALKNNFLVLCETLNVDLTPTKYNTRHNASLIFQNNKDLEPMFGLEQEFFISEIDTDSDTFVTELKPLCFNSKYEKIGILDRPESNIDGVVCYGEGEYYCGVGFNNAIGREMIEETLQNLMYSNLEITGLNAEVSPSQWEFQICSIGIDAADSLILLRYICNRTFEKYNCIMDLSPKPRKELNGSGCHVNFSTKEMRSSNGYTKIEDAIIKLEKNHSLHIKHYGSGNDKRLTGSHETSSIDKFSYGIGSRNTSIRIPNDIFKNKCGYLEDRRPSSTMDPYIVTSLIYASSCDLNHNFS